MPRAGTYQNTMIGRQTKQTMVRIGAPPTNAHISIIAVLALRVWMWGISRGSVGGCWEGEIGHRVLVQDARWFSLGEAWDLAEPCVIVMVVHWVWCTAALWALRSLRQIAVLVDVHHTLGHFLWLALYGLGRSCFGFLGAWTRRGLALSSAGLRGREQRWLTMTAQQGLIERLNAQEERRYNQETWMEMLTEPAI